MRNENPVDIIKIIVIENHKLLRYGLRTVFEANYPFIQIIGEAEDGLTGVNLAKILNPDIILCSLGLPVINGVDVTKMITENIPDAKVVIFTTHRYEGVKEVIKAGAKAYMLKDNSPEGLVLLLRYVHEGGSWIDPLVEKYGSYIYDIFSQDKIKAEKLLLDHQTEIYTKIIDNSGNLKYINCEITEYTTNFINKNLKYLSEAEIILVRLVLCGKNFKQISSLLEMKESEIKSAILNIMNATNWFLL